MNEIHTDDDSFLDKPFGQASLRDHLRWTDYREERHTPFGTAIREFLVVSDSEMAVQFSCHHPNDVAQINFALEKWAGDWTLVKHGGKRGRESRPWQPRWHRAEIAPELFRNVIVEGSWFFQLPDGKRRIFDLEQLAAGHFDLTVTYCIADEPAVREELRQLYAWIDEHHYLKGQTIKGDGDLLPNPDRLTWDDVVLSDEARRPIIDNVRQFLELREAFKKSGVPNRRGLLLYGPPGNGKTMIGRILSATKAATFMYLTAADADDLPWLRRAFDLARRLKPTIVFLEDLDLYAVDRRDSSNIRTLGEILAQLDGLESNDGLMVIATTNDLTAIEPALRERPSRFDVVVEIGPPEPEARRKILARRLAKCAPPPPELLDEAVARTDGFSAAQVQEAAWRIIQQAILAGSLTPDGLAQPTLRALEAALPGLGANSGRRRVGFTQYTRENQPVNGARPVAPGTPHDENRSTKITTVSNKSWTTRQHAF